jgi:hypothetical protein
MHKRLSFFLGGNPAQPLHLHRGAWLNGVSGQLFFEGIGSDIPLIEAINQQILEPHELTGA